PGALLSSHGPVKARSVPCRRVMWNCSGVSSFAHSSSVLRIFSSLASAIEILLADAGRANRAGVSAQSTVGKRPFLDKTSLYDRHRAVKPRPSPGANPNFHGRDGKQEWDRAQHP